MANELSTSKIQDNQFHLGQLELSFIVKRVIRHFQYTHNNESPEAVVIPLLKEVDGVKILYEQETAMETRPKTGGVGKPSSSDNS